MFYCHICVALSPPPRDCFMIYRKVSLQFNVALVLFSLVNDYCACCIFTLCDFLVARKKNKKQNRISANYQLNRLDWTAGNVPQCDSLVP